MKKTTATRWLILALLTGCAADDSGDSTGRLDDALDASEKTDILFDSAGYDSMVPSVDAVVDAGSLDSTPADAGPQDAGPTDSGPTDVGADDASVSVDVGSPPLDAGSGCPQGLTCVTSLPFVDESTTAGGSVELDFYSCSPGTDESGPERIYQVDVAEAGFLSAVVYDGGGVDVDVHILSAPDAAACVARGHHQAAVDVEAGTVWIVVDTWVNDDGEPLSGDFTLEIGLTAPSVGGCATDTGVMERVGDGGTHLVMPATGPMVLEAHLVTQDEPPPYPSTPTEELSAHYALSQSVSGFVMYREQNWAPLEGGDFYGAGNGTPTIFPTLHEAWYVNMYWTKESRPAKGTRMLLRLPGTARAVVVAAGYETGPGNLAHVGGTPEETHHYLGTTHLSEMIIGIASDQTLDYGPRRCQ